VAYFSGVHPVHRDDDLQLKLAIKCCYNSMMMMMMMVLFILSVAETVAAVVLSLFVSCVIIMCVAIIFLLRKRSRLSCRRNRFSQYAIALYNIISVDYFLFSPSLSLCYCSRYPVAALALAIGLKGSSPLQFFPPAPSEFLLAYIFYELK